jgi:hypothetical protein
MLDVKRVGTQWMQQIPLQATHLEQVYQYHLRNLDAPASKLSNYPAPEHPISGMFLPVALREHSADSSDSLSVQSCLIS